MALDISPRIRLADSDLTFHFIRAGGPGGQNVNKVASAVQLRFNVRTCPNLPEALRESLFVPAKVVLPFLMNLHEMRFGVPISFGQHSESAL